MSELKSKIEIDQMAGVVYYIPCKDCEIGYVGQTKQVLKKRLSGHRYDKAEKTALHHHQDSKNHRFDFEGAKILASEKHYFPRVLLEMVHILKNRDKVCNYCADVDGLSSVYHKFFLSELEGAST